MTCSEAFSSYILRAIGIGERLLPRSDIELCEQVILIGSGMIWNVFFATIAIALGFFLALLLALGKNSSKPWVKRLSSGFVYFFRGTPLFIQFFFAYEIFVLLPKYSIEIPLGFTTITAETKWLTKAWLGATIVLFFNTASYSAEIFYGALRAVPNGEIDAGKALGLSKKQRFRYIVFPTMLRLSWPAYTNEAVFIFHSTTLVYLSSFPSWQQKGDAFYYASYFAEKTFNPFISFPIIGGYFILISLCILFAFGRIRKRLSRHIYRQ